MSYTVNVLPYVVSTLQGIDGVGAVNSYPRHSIFVASHKEYFLASDGKFRGWIVDRNAAPAEGNMSSQVIRNHVVVLRGYYGLKDDAESSNEFQQDIDDVLLTFDSLIRLGDSNNGVVKIGAAQLSDKREEMFGGTLCHLCEIILQFQEETTS